MQIFCQARERERRKDQRDREPERQIRQRLRVQRIRPWKMTRRKRRSCLRMQTGRKLLISNKDREQEAFRLYSESEAWEDAEQRFMHYVTFNYCRFYTKHMQKVV